MLDRLLEFYEGDEERVGFILRNGEIVEVENVCHDPKNGFDVKGEDLIRYEHEMVATWHTHPGADSNLSQGDYESFRAWPNLRHYIIGQDGIRAYEVRDGEVVNVDA